MRLFQETYISTILLGVILGGLPRCTAAACIGDCDGNGEVTVNELVTMVNISLGATPLSSCVAGDDDGSGDITINEIVAAVNNAQGGCPQAPATPTPSPLPTPTPSPAAAFPQIHSTILEVTCTDRGCHNANDQSGGLVLQGSAAYANLVGAPPVNLAANQAGMLRVDPGNPANSFLLTKLTLSAAFDPQLGSRMPLGKAPLSAAEIQLISDWITQGAPP
jgi:hypothetical protein